MPAFNGKSADRTALDFAAWKTIVHYVAFYHSLRCERSFSIGLPYSHPSLYPSRTPLSPHMAHSVGPSTPSRIGPFVIPQKALSGGGGHLAIRRGRTMPLHSYARYRLRPGDSESTVIYRRGSGGAKRTFPYRPTVRQRIISRVSGPKKTNFMADLREQLSFLLHVQRVHWDWRAIN